MKSLSLAFSSQFSTPEAIFSSKMANSATQMAGNTVVMYNKLPGQILEADRKIISTTEAQCRSKYFKKEIFRFANFKYTKREIYKSQSQISRHSRRKPHFIHLSLRPTVNSTDWMEWSGSKLRTGVRLGPLYCALQSWKVKMKN